MDMRLPAEEFSAVFEDGIEAPALAWTTAAVAPLAVYLGGQPGCGKSTVARSSAALFGSDNFVHVDVDRLRELHPAYLPMVANPATEKAAPSAVQRDCSAWADKLRDSAMDGRRNMLVESTMRSPEQVRESAVALRSAGYAVEARILAVHAKSSEVSLLQRFEHEKLVLGYGRDIPLDYHSMAAAGIIDTVCMIEDEKLFDRLVVFNRAGLAIYENVLVEGEWEHAPDGARVMEAFREASYDVTEKNNIAVLWDGVVDMMRQRGAVEADVRAVGARRDAAKMIAAGAPGVGLAGDVESQPFFDAVAKMSAGQLDDWYEENVGYRLSEDSKEPILESRARVAEMMFLHAGGDERDFPVDAGERMLLAEAKMELLRRDGLRGFMVDQGDFSGKIVAHHLEMGVVVQKVGRDSDKIAQHDGAKLSRLPEVGEVVGIKYLGGVGRVTEREVVKDRGR